MEARYSQEQCNFVIFFHFLMSWFQSTTDAIILKSVILLTQSSGFTPRRGKYFIGNSFLTSSCSSTNWIWYLSSELKSFEFIVQGWIFELGVKGQTWSYQEYQWIFKGVPASLSLITANWLHTASWAHTFFPWGLAELTERHLVRFSHTPIHHEARLIAYYSFFCQIII